MVEAAQGLAVDSGDADILAPDRIGQDRGMDPKIRTR
jgi:hypothetical protein